MLYMPEANMDMVYINAYGYNLRQLDPQLPDSCKSFDEKDFLSCPSHPNAPKFQFDMLKLRLGQYVDALAHVLNTGKTWENRGGVRSGLEKLRLVNSRIELGWYNI